MRIPGAKGAAERALQREPDLAEAITSLGKVLGWHEWKFADAEVQLARAVTLAPNYAEAHYVRGTMLPAVGRLSDAIDTMRKALVLDPLSVHYSEWLARFLLYDRDYDAAIAQGERTMEMDEICHRAQHYVGAAHLAKGDAETALSWFRRGQSLERAPRAWDAMIVRALAALGQHEEAEAILARLEEESRRQYLRGEIIATGYAAAGDLDKAFASLERAYQDRSAGLMYLKVDPGYGPLRGDPRYADLVKRIGLV